MALRYISAELAADFPLPPLDNDHLIVRTPRRVPLDFKFLILDRSAWELVEPATYSRYWLVRIFLPRGARWNFSDPNAIVVFDDIPERAPALETYVKERYIERLDTPKFFLDYFCVNMIEAPHFLALHKNRLRTNKFKICKTADSGLTQDVYWHNRSTQKLDRVSTREFGDDTISNVAHGFVKLLPGLNNGDVRLKLRGINKRFKNAAVADYLDEFNSSTADETQLSQKKQHTSSSLGTTIMALIHTDFDQEPISARLSVEKKKPKPYLVITIGPTGSGKSTLMNKATEHLGVRSFESFLIDDLVENDPVYKAKVAAILKKIRLQKLLEPSQALYDEFGDAYFSVRKKEGCKKPGGCSALFNENLKKAIKARKNIVFETTGQSYPAWLMELTASTYTIVLAYTLVSFCQLIQRNQKRALTQAQAFLKNSVRTPAPRLPNVSVDGPYRSGIERVKKVLIDTVQNNCYSIDAKNTKVCGKTPLDRILLFDNNKRPMRLVADMSKTSKLSEKAVRKIIDTYMRTQEKTCVLKK